MEWRVGVLRSGAENVAWTDSGDESCWCVARRRAIDELHVLAVREGCRQEYRMQVGDVPVLLWPGLGEDGRLDLSGINDALPEDRDDLSHW